MWGGAHRPSGWIKVNTNGAAKGKPGMAGAGGLIRDDFGRWLGGFSQNIGITTSIAAELWAVKMGLELAWDLGVTKLILEVDFEVVCHFLRSNHNDVGGNKALLRDIRALLLHEWLIVPEHVYCESNMCADWLANHALLLPLGAYRLANCPRELDLVLFGDVAGSTVSYLFIA
ncbi:hypothetical protein CRG98_039123 [Punica granatum]|uniref:RNase H type-1 domain-containing protein n=1 Tax=Punica granatum TaxID=22663 RepID=A0A2I0I918_PUNGR|nr:hypothetical protein CRG98_039123 [Punica granatum]